VVNGAAGAIGSAVARRLFEAGAHVVISDLPGEGLSRIESELAEIDKRRVVAVPANVCDEEQVRMLFDETILAFGGLDIVVLNAGIAHVAAIADLQLADWQRVQDVNATGTLLCLREASRVLQAQRLGGADHRQRLQERAFTGRGFRRVFGQQGKRGAAGQGRGARAGRRTG
jgi:NAD(P)-dependent dehydrogenase (short-subunit alcohol dehydrogenase family)